MSDSIIVNVNPSPTDLVVINANQNTTNQSVNVNDGATSTIISVSSVFPPPLIVQPTDLNINENININQGGFVFSVNGKIGHVIITKEEIGLNQVDNTSDLNKPLSLAQIQALALKANQSDLATVSAAQDAFYVDTANKVVKFAPAGNLVIANSASWIFTSQQVIPNYTNWNEAFTNISQNSSFYVGLSTASVAIWDSVYATTKSSSAFWQQAYTNILANSSSYIAGGNLVNVVTGYVPLSGGFLTGILSTSSILSSNNIIYAIGGNSDLWNSVYNFINATSASEEDQNESVSFILANSANILEVNAKVNAISGDWDSVYSSWNSASSDLIAVETFVKETSANNSIFNTVCSLSSNWNSVYSNWNNTSSNIVQVNTIVNNNSAEWDSIYSLASGLSGNWSSLGTLTNTIVTDLSVGAITAAQVFSAGTTFQQFAEALLTKIYYPSYTNRTLTVTSNYGANGTNVEIGTQSVTLTLTYTRGQIRGKTVNSIWDPNFLQGFRTGPAIIYIIFENISTSNFSTSGNAIITEGSNTYNVTCNFGAGDQPVDSRNNPFETALPANSVSTTMTLNGRRRAFFGADANNFAPTNSTQVRALPQNLLAPVDGSTFTVNVANGAARVIIAYPATLRNVTQIYYPPLQSDVKNTFTLTTVSVSAANSLFPTNYKVYSYIPAIPFGSSTTYQVTI